MLHDVGLADEMRGLLQVGPWRQLFSITNTTYKEMTLEFSMTFELERGMISFHKADMIQF